MSVTELRLETSGIRCQMVGLATAALQPDLFSQVAIREGMSSLRHLVEAPIKYEAAPDLFCLDLHKEFDLDQMAKLASPVQITSVPAAMTNLTRSR